MISEKEIIDEQITIQDIKLRLNYFFDKAFDYPRKIKDEACYLEYKKAVQEFHSIKSIEDYFVQNSSFEKIKNGDSEWIDQAILYLEVDPFYFRSGYLKEKLIDKLKQAPLDENRIKRIQNLILGVIQKCFRREMKYFCKLAKAVSSDIFIDQISHLKKSRKEGVRIRAEYFLQYIKSNYN